MCPRTVVDKTKEEAKTVADTTVDTTKTVGDKTVDTSKTVANKTVDTTKDSREQNQIRHESGDRRDGRRCEENRQGDQESHRALETLKEKLMA